MDSDLARTFQRLSKREATDLRRSTGSRPGAATTDPSEDAHASGTCDDTCPRCSE